MVELLNESNIDYSSFNILSDEEVRQGITRVCQHHMGCFVHAAFLESQG